MLLREMVPRATGASRLPGVRVRTCERVSGAGVACIRGHPSLQAWPGPPVGVFGFGTEAVELRVRNEGTGNTGGCTGSWDADGAAVPGAAGMRGGLAPSSRALCVWRP